MPTKPRRLMCRKPNIHSPLSTGNQIRKHRIIMCTRIKLCLTNTQQRHLCLLWGRLFLCAFKLDSKLGTYCDGKVRSGDTQKGECVDGAGEVLRGWWGLETGEEFFEAGSGGLVGGVLGCGEVGCFYLDGLEGCRVEVH